MKKVYVIYRIVSEYFGEYPNNSIRYVLIEENQCIDELEALSLVEKYVQKEPNSEFTIVPVFTSLR